MAAETHISILGIVLAVIFLVTMGIMIRWMFHPPKPVPLSAAKARGAVGSIKRILVPTSGTYYSEQGIELACRLGMEQKAEILVINVLEIPRTLPLEAPMPDVEAKSRDIVKRGETIVQLKGLLAKSEVKRGRVAGEEIIRAAKDWEADLIVMGIRSQIRMASEVLGRTSHLILNRAPCAVILHKLAA